MPQLPTTRPRAAALAATLLLSLPIQGTLQDEATIVPVTAQAHGDPVRVELTWGHIGTTPSRSHQPASIDIYRRPVGASADLFVPIYHTTNTSLRFYADESIEVGVLYEYAVGANYSDGNGKTYSFPREGYVASGWQVPLEDQRGTLLLLVTEKISKALPAPLTRFERDLAGAGWRVLRETVPEDPLQPGSDYNGDHATDPRPIKALIAGALHAHNDLRAVVLLGHVTMPFTSMASPDGHEARAHFTDAYYADTDEEWSDAHDFTSTFQLSARVHPYNGPGDFRWDRTRLDGRELLVGRIDLTGLPNLRTPEVDLIERYLRKNHLFRHGWLPVERAGIYSTNLSLIGRTIGNMAAYVGHARVTDIGGQDWSDYTARVDRSFLWGVAGASGSHEATTGISTSTMATGNYRVAFANFGASHMMDAYKTDSALRAFLAGPVLGLGSIVSHGFYGEIKFPQFAMGRPLGEVNVGEAIDHPVAVTHPDYAASGAYPGSHYVFESVYANLFGDPTLLLHQTLPPRALDVEASGAQAQLSWHPSGADRLVGYHVYRSLRDTWEFTRLTDDPISGTSYTDSSDRSTDVVYMVRAVNLETRGTGTYFAASQGIFATLALDDSSNARPAAHAQSLQTDETTPIAVSLQASDGDGDAVTFLVVEPPLYGALTGSGSAIAYQPGPEAFGVDQFRFVADDGTASSEPATVRIQIDRQVPLITGHPRPWQSFRRGKVIFEVHALGRAPLVYEWFKDGQFLGHDEPQLEIDRVSYGDAGEYHVTVSNTIGSAISRTATLSVAENPVVGSYGAWEAGIAWPHDSDGPSADANGNGWSNWWEYLLAQDPLAAATRFRVFVVRGSGRASDQAYLQWDFERRSSNHRLHARSSSNLSRWHLLTDETLVNEVLLDEDPQGDGSLEAVRLLARLLPGEPVFLALRPAPTAD